jgi:hypothetical protein
VRIWFTITRGAYSQRMPHTSFDRAFAGGRAILPAAAFEAARAC